MAPPVPLPARDTRKERLLAWKLEKEASAAAEKRRARSPSPGGSVRSGGSSGSWPAARADDKQRILQRRRENMAAPSLENMKRKHQGDPVGDERVRRWQAEMENDAEEAELSATAQAAAEAALEPGRYNGDRHQGNGDERELKARVSSGETSPNPYSSSIASDSDGDNQRSEPGMCRGSADGDEDDPHFEQEDKAFKEALTHPEDVETDDLAGSYFTLDPANAIPLGGQSPPLSDDEQQEEYEDEQRKTIRRTVEKVDVDVRVHRSVETVVVPSDPEQPPRTLVHAVSDDETSFSATEERATTLRSPAEDAEDASTSSVAMERDRAATNASISRRKPGARGCYGCIMVLLVAVLAIGVAAGGVIIWRDPTSPLARSMKHAAALTVTTVGSTAVDSAHWVEYRLQESTLAPVIQKFAVALDSVVANTSHWSTAVTLHLQAAAADGWSGLKAQVEAAMSEPRGVYHALANKAANVSGSMKDYVVSRWTKYVHGGRLAGGDDHATFVDPLAGERVRMAAIKQQLDHQEAWVLKELERMKARRAAYSSATDSLLSESKSMISDSIHEAKDSAVRRIKTFSEQIAAVLKGSAYQEAADDGTTAGKPVEASDVPDHQVEGEPAQVDKTDKGPAQDRNEEVDSRHSQAAALVHDEDDRPQPTTPVDDGAQMSALEDAVAEAAESLLSDEADIVRITQSIEEVVVEADMAAAVQELEAWSRLEAVSDAGLLRVATEQVQQSAEVLADVTTQRQAAEEAVEALAVLENGLEAELTAAQMVHQVASVEAEEHRAEAADTLDNLKLAQELEEGTRNSVGQVDSVREELLPIANEEELGLEITTVKVAAELLKTGAEIEDETLALREQLEAARAAAESEAMESVCTDAHCLTDSEAIERVCEGAQCLAESEAVERVCEGVLCAAAAVEQILQDVGAHIDAEKQDGAALGELTKPEAQLIEDVGDQIVVPEVVDIVSPLIPSPDLNIIIGSRVASASLAHLVPIAVFSSVFLSLAIVSGYYLRRAWKLRQQRIARHLRWRRRVERKRRQWPTEDEVEDEAEEVVLLSGPSADSSSVASDSGENDTASASSSYEAHHDGADYANADTFGDEEETEVDGAFGASGPSEQRARSSMMSNLEFSDVALSSAAPGTQPNSFMRVTRHAAQRVLSYSPVTSDSAPTPSRGIESEESK